MNRTPLGIICFALTITSATCDMRTLRPVEKCQEFLTIFRFLTPLLSSKEGTVIMSAMLILFFPNNIAIVTFLKDILENSHTCQMLEHP